MARFANMVLAYFIIGTVMVGGGAIDYEEAGVAQFFIEQDGSAFTWSSEPGGIIAGIGNTVTQIVGLAVGVVQLVYNLVFRLLTYLNWPVIVLASHNAPPMAVFLIGGSFQVAFYMSAVRLWRTSA